jgi:hypothetical protein
MCLYAPAVSISGTGDRVFLSKLSLLKPQQSTKQLHPTWLAPQPNGRAIAENEVSARKRGEPVNFPRSLLSLERPVPETLMP